MKLSTESSSSSRPSAEDVRPDVAKLRKMLVCSIFGWPSSGDEHAEAIWMFDELMRARDADLAEAERQLAEYRADAERYRWLREQSHPFGSIWYSLTALDAEIDAALNGGRQEG